MEELFCRIKNLKGCVIIMKKVFLMTTLVFLLSLSAFCFASEKDAGLENYAYAKAMAVSYASDIKEIYNKHDGRISYEDYLDAKTKYQLAAAKFTALKSTLELSIINKAALNKDTIKKLTNLGNGAMKDFNDFSYKANLLILGGPSLTESGGLTLVTDLITIWGNYKEIREAKITRLIAWLDDYYDWPTWEKIGTTTTEAKTTDITTIVGNKTTKTNNTTTLQH